MKQQFQTSTPLRTGVVVCGVMVYALALLAGCSSVDSNPPPEDCRFRNDGECDDGRPGAVSNECPFGTDPEDCEGVQPPPPSDNGDTAASATRSITSSQQGTVSLASGAALDVPVGAVPPKTDGTDGTMVFSIESGVNPPSFNIGPGMVLGKVFKYGPSGFTFARPVKVTLAVSDVQADGLTFAMYDEERDQWISVPGAIDADNGTVSADLQHFSYMSTAYWSGSAWENARPFGWGTLRTSAISGTSMSFTVCIESFSLAFPDRDQVTFGAVDATMSVGGLFSASLRLPQGTYSLGVTAFDNSTGALLGQAPLGSYTISAWDSGVNSGEGVFIDRSAWPASADLTPGRSACLATPTSSVGTGEVQVTLSWQSHTDLDLRVTPPSGVPIDYTNTMGNDGGELDRDHTCDSQEEDGLIESGKVENIVWKTDAPTGSYHVEVSYFEDCANVGETTFDVRVIAPGFLRTVRRTASTEDPDTMVLEFTVPVN